MRIPHQRLTVDGCPHKLDFLGRGLAQIDAIIAQQALGDEDVRRLMKIPGIDAVITATLPAARARAAARLPARCHADSARWPCRGARPTRP